MHKNHTLLLILGRSATGKDSLTDQLCERTGLTKLISYTTRERRNGEGETHKFVSEEVYHQMKAEGKVAAETKIGEYYYWSTIDQLYENDVYIIDCIGVKTLQNLNLSNLNFVTVYIHIDEQERQRRALEFRGDDKKKFISRSFSEKKQFEELEKNVDYDYSIKNNDFTTSYSVLRWIAMVNGILTPDKLIKKENEQ